MKPCPYKIVVLLDISKNKIIGSGTLLIEKKFIRSLGTVLFYGIIRFIYRLAILKTLL